MLLECVVACKLSYGSECDWPRAKLVGPACFLMVLLVSVIEPQLTLSWYVCVDVIEPQLTLSW